MNTLKRHDFFKKTAQAGMACCDECKVLTTCGKELWGRFPTFKDKVIEMQQTYQEAKN